MKREIKFRAWDNLENRWYEPTFEGYRGKIEEIMLSPRGRLTMRTMTELIDESMFPNRFELMQYTGLKDKNGREIYEGDIVKNEYGKVMDIQYDPRSAAFGVGDYYFGTIGSGKIIEVIGNIFENPKLLEEKQ
ncbi:YopX family protein [Lacticaseibacillus paracasei]|uniref:YopX family protein n=1 Tax=Lacticaseibacillus paracasei TaxID=1597 RepID=UPI0023616083|nr:YopX family protein [Lacticaseibacillus paracasei]